MNFVLKVTVILSFIVCYVQCSIHTLSLNGQNEEIKMLLETNPGFANFKDDYGNLPLDYAIMGNRPDTVQVLLENGACPHKFTNRNKDGFYDTPYTFSNRLIDKQLRDIMYDFVESGGYKRKYCEHRMYSDPEYNKYVEDV